MSSTKKSSSGAKKASDVILEPDGKINTSKLEESMHKALEFDVKYRQTDNAKKRAIKVSGSYEDFKARVACAHLKKLSSKDIDSLKMSKREAGHKALNADTGEGIVTSSINSTSHTEESASILSKEFQEVSMKQSEASLSKLTGSMFSKKPKSFLELNRDFRRLKEIDDRKRYLDFVGLKKCIKLMNTDSDAEFFENIIIAVLTNVGYSGAISSTDSDTTRSNSNSNNNTNSNSSNDVSVFTSIPAPGISIDVEASDASLTAADGHDEEDSDVDTALKALQWVDALKDLSKFEMLKCFLAPATKTLLSSFLDSIDDGKRTSSNEGDHNLSDLCDALRGHYL